MKGIPNIYFHKLNIICQNRMHQIIISIKHEFFSLFLVLAYVHLMNYKFSHKNINKFVVIIKHIR